jgi:hypothetical protein
MQWKIEPIPGYGILGQLTQSVPGTSPSNRATANKPALFPEQDCLRWQNKDFYPSAWFGIRWVV